MRIYLEIGDIAPHVFIQLLRNKQGRRVCQQMLAAYGKAVAGAMDGDVVFDSSRDASHHFLDVNSDIFKENGDYIILADGITEEYLRTRFGGRLTTKLAKALAIADGITLMWNCPT